MSLWGRHHASMVAIAQAMLGDGHLAEDAAQEAFAKAARRLDSLKKPARFACWLGAICRNTARDIRRRTPRTVSLGERDLAAPPSSQDADLEAVRVAMDRLPDQARELLHLRYRNELSYRQIGELLGISTQAVQGRLRRARNEVREHLERSRRGGRLQ